MGNRCRGPHRADTSQNTVAWRDIVPTLHARASPAVVRFRSLRGKPGVTVRVRPCRIVVKSRQHAHIRQSQGFPLRLFWQDSRILPAHTRINCGLETGTAADGEIVPATAPRRSADPIAIRERHDRNGQDGRRAVFFDAERLPHGPACDSPRGTCPYTTSGHAPSRPAAPARQAARGCRGPVRSFLEPNSRPPQFTGPCPVSGPRFHPGQRHPPGARTGSAPGS